MVDSGPDTYCIRDTGGNVDADRLAHSVVDSGSDADCKSFANTAANPDSDGNAQPYAVSYQHSDQLAYAERLAVAVPDPMGDAHPGVYRLADGGADPERAGHSDSYTDSSFPPVS